MKTLMVAVIMAALVGSALAAPKTSGQAGQAARCPAPTAYQRCLLAIPGASYNQQECKVYGAAGHSDAHVACARAHGRQ